ncbi:MAG: esterase-like activity of phytase family protein, partial [Tepidiforma sp.]
KGAPNSCPVYSPWPGGAGWSNASLPGAFGGNLSGLAYEPSGSAARGTLWAVRNGPGTLYRLSWNGSAWVPSGGDWAAGRPLRYEDGTGDPDAEGVTFAGSPAAGIYVATERNNAAGAVSRPSILRFDPAQAGAQLNATHEWALAADLPALGPNLGLEGIAWVPDAFLLAAGFFDESRGGPYDPANYPNHGGGLFFVGVEANGFIYAYALDHAAETFTRVATIDSGFPMVAEVVFDPALGRLWAVCDDVCQGRTHLLAIDAAGRFAIDQRFERPAGTPNLANEGFTVAAASECIAGSKPVYWADDGEAGGISIRAGTLDCTAETTPPVAAPVAAPAPNGAGWNTADVTITWNWSDEGSGIDPANCTAASTATGEGVITLSADCADLAGNVGSSSFTVRIDRTPPQVAVTGVANGAVYTLGYDVPIAGCATTDALSGVAVQAALTVSGPGPGTVTATCSGAVDVAGNAAPAVSVTYTVLTPLQGLQAALQQYLANHPQLNSCL